LPTGKDNGVYVRVYIFKRKHEERVGYSMSVSGKSFFNIKKSLLRI